MYYELDDHSSRLFDQYWSDLNPVGRTGDNAYDRFAWTDADMQLRHWFKAAARQIGLTVTYDRAGNTWAWWGDPDADGPGLVLGSHLDSVPSGGAFDGPLGITSALVAIDQLRRNGFQPTTPVAVAVFNDEEGARFGVACTGSRLLTGVSDPEEVMARRDIDGISYAEAVAGVGVDPHRIGPDPEAMARIKWFVELHVEQGKALADTEFPVAVGSAIWPHGRYRVDLYGRADHAGTTRLEDRNDPMLTLAELVQKTRSAAETHNAHATVGKVLVHPNGVNAIPSHVAAWVDARAAAVENVQKVVHDISQIRQLLCESWTDRTEFDVDLTSAVAASLALSGNDVPVLETGAGHDAGVMANAGIPTTMLFVRNPTGISHSPEEFADRGDCLVGVGALIKVIMDLAKPVVTEHHKN